MRKTLIFLSLIFSAYLSWGQGYTFTNGSGLSVAVDVINECDTDGNGRVIFTVLTSVGNEDASLQSFFNPPFFSIIIGPEPLTFGDPISIPLSGGFSADNFNFVIQSNNSGNTGGSISLVDLSSASINVNGATDLINNDPNCSPLDAQIDIDIIGGSSGLTGATNQTQDGYLNFKIDTDNSLGSINGNTQISNNVDFASEFGIPALPGGEYTITVTDPYSSCSDLIQSFTVIDPKPGAFTISTTTDPVCDGDNIQIVLDNTDSGVTYTVYLDGTPTATSALGTGASVNFPTFLSSTYTGGDDIVVFAEIGSCTSVFSTNTLNIVVNGVPVLDPTLDDSACNDEAIGIVLGVDVGSIAASTYNITAINTNGLTASAGGPVVANGVLANEISDDAWTNNTGLDVDVEYTVVPVSASGCEGNAVIVTVTIGTEPTLDPTLDDSACSDEAIGIVLGVDVGSIAASTYNITAINTNGLTASAGGPVVANGVLANEISDDAWTNNTGLDVDVEYTVVPVSASGCEGNAVIVTVTIGTEPTLDPTLDDSACSDEAIGIVLGVDVGSIAASTYNITAINTNGLTASAGGPVVANGVLANEISDDAWTNNTGLDVDVEYTVVPVSASGCEGNAVIVTVMIGTEPTLDPTLDDSACSDEAIGIVLGVDVGSIAASTYNITAINTNGLTASAGGPVVANGVLANEISDDAWTNNTGLDVDVEYTVVPVSASGCEGNAVIVTVTIGTEPTLDPTLDDSACSDEAIGIVLGVDVGSIAASTYNITAINTNGLTASAGGPVVANGVLANEISDDAWTNNTGLDVDVEYTVVPVSASGCEGNAVIVTVTIGTEPTLDPTLDDSACSDEAIGIVLGVDVGSIAASTYNITAINTNGLTASAGGPVVANGVLANEISDDAWTNNTGLDVDVEYTVVPVSASGCEGNAVIVTVTIGTEPTLDPTLDDSACNDEAIGIVLGVDVGSIAASTYNITAINTNGLTASAGGPVVANGVLANEISDDAWTNNTGLDVDVEYTVVPVSASGCEGNAVIVTVTIGTEPTLDPTLDDSACSDEAIGIVLGVDVGSIAASTYNITAINTNGLTASAGGPVVANGVLANEISDDAWTNNTGLDVDVEYTVVPVSASGCEGNAVIVTVMIGTEPTLDPTLDDSACSDEAIGIVLGVDVGSIAASTYNITAINTNGLTASAGGPVVANGVLANEISDDAWTNNTGLDVDVEYTVVPVSASGCEGNAVIVTVMIGTEPTLDPTLDDSACSDEAIGIVLGVDVGSIAASTYNITAINTNGLTASAGGPVVANGVLANEISDDAWTNNTGLDVDVEYTVVPVSASGCEGNAVIVTVTIGTEPTLDPTLDDSACSDEAIGIVLGVDVGSIAASTYNITAINTNGLTASAGGPVVANGVLANEISDDAWTNNTGLDVDVEYTVVPVSASGCEGNAVIVTVTIGTEPTLDPTLDDSACSDEAIGIVLGVDVGSIAASTYNITAINTNGLTASAGGPVVANGVLANEISDDAWTNNTGLDVDVEYTVVPVSASGCEGNAVIVTVMIGTEPTLDPTLDDSACSDEAIGIVLGVDVGSIAASTYNITAINTNGLTASAGGPVVANGVLANEISDDAWTNNTGLDVDVEYTVVPVSASGCEGNAVIVTVTIGTEPTLDPTLDDSACSDEAIGIVLGVDVGSIAASTYNITAINTNGLTASAGGPVVANGVLANEISDDAWTNNTGLDVDVEYTVVPVSASGCEGNAVIVTVTIGTEPTLDPTLDDSACSDEAIGIVLGVDVGSIAASTYNITAINTNGLTASAGGPVVANGVLANEISDDAWTNNTGLDVDVEYTVVPVSASGCEGNAVIVTVTIGTEPTLDPTLDDSACSDEAIGIVLGVDVGSIAASTYNITAINTNGLTASAGGPVVANGVLANEISDDAWTNNTGLDVDVEYTVVPVSASGCEGNAVIITVTIIDVLTANNQTPQACSDDAGGNTATVDLTALESSINNSGSVTFNWFENNGPLSNPIATPTSYTVTNGVSIFAQVVLGSCNNVATVTYTVNPSPDLPQNPVDAVACSDDITGASLTVDDPGAGFIVRWFTTYTSPAVNTPVVDPTDGTISGANDEVFTPASNADATYFAVIENTTTNCFSGEVTLQHVQDIRPTAADADADDAVAFLQTCDDEIVLGATPPDNGGTGTWSYNGLLYYEDFKSLGDGAISDSDLFGWSRDVLGATFDGDDHFEVRSGFMSVNDTDGEVIWESNPIDISLIANFDISIEAYQSSVNEADDYIELYYQIDANPEVQVGARLDDNFLNAIISGTSIATGGGASLTIRVKTDVIDDADFIQFDNVVLIQTGSENIIFDDINSATATVTGLPLTAGVTTPTTFTWTVSSALGGCSPSQDNVTVNRLPQPEGAYDTRETCSDSDLDYNIQTENIDVLGNSIQSEFTYTVVSDNETEVAAAPARTIASNANITDTYINLTPVDVVITYTVTPIETASGRNCEGDPFDIEFTIRPEPVMDPALATAEACSDGAIGVVLNTNGTSIGADRYTVNLVSQDANLTGTPTTGVLLSSNAILNDQFMNVSSTSGTVVYEVIPHSAVADGGCVGDVFNITVTINPEPLGANDLLAAICSREAINYDIQLSNIDGLGNGVASNFTYTVLSDNEAEVPAASDRTVASNASITDNYVNTTDGDVEITYTIIPIESGSGNSCAGDPFDIVFTIQPEPVVADIVESVCTGNTIDVLLPTTDDSGLTIDSYNVAANVPVGVTGTPTTATGTMDINLIAGDTFTNGTAGDLDVVYTITPITADGCEGDDFTVTVTISVAAPTATISGTTTICSGESTDLTFTLTGVAPWTVEYSDGTTTFNEIGIATSPFTVSVSPTLNTTYTLVSVEDDCTTGSVSGSAIITVQNVLGNPNTFGNETWIGYVFDDSDDLATPLPGRIDFANDKYRGFIDETDIPLIGTSSIYNVSTDMFDLNPETGSVFGPNLCNSYDDHFSIRLRMSKTFTEGAYTFTLGADTGVRFFIDGNAVLTDPTSFDPSTYSTYTTNPICLDGSHDLVIEYYERVDISRLTFDYVEASVTIVQSPSQLCAGDPATFTATPLNAGTTPTFQWQIDGVDVFGPSGTGVTFASNSLNDGEMVTVVMTPDGVSCEFTSNIIEIDIVTTPTAPTVEGADEYCVGETTITDLTVTGGVDISWYEDATLTTELVSGDTFNPETDLLPSFSTAAPASFSVFVTETLSCGESLATEFVINITDALPSAPTVAGTMSYCVGDLNADVTDLSASGADIKWYEDAALTVPLVSGNTFNPTSITLWSTTTTATFSVFVTNETSCGESTSTQVDIEINDVPATPIANDASNILCTSFDANWNAVVGATSYRVEVASDIGFTSIFINQSVPTNILSVTAGLSQGTNYFYRVYSVNACGESIASNEISLTTSSTGCGGGTDCGAFTAINPILTRPTCTNNNDGSIAFDIQGGTGNYLVQMIDSGGNPFSTQSAMPTFNNLSPSIYTYTVTDLGNSNICDDGRSVVLEILSTVEGELLGGSTENISCFGETGAVTLTNITPVLGQYFYSIDGGSSWIALSGDNRVEGLNAGITSIRLGSVANDPCPDIIDVTITSVNPIITVNATPSNLTTCDSSDGQVSVDFPPSGGANTGNDDWFIAFKRTSSAITDGDFGTFNEDIIYNNLSADNYTLYIRDISGCTINEAFDIQAPGTIDFTLTQTNAATCAGSGLDGVINVDVTNGARPFFYSVDGNDFIEAPGFNFSIKDLAVGVHEVVMKSDLDDDGCLTQQVATVTGFGLVDFSFEKTDVTCNLDGDGEISLTDIIGSEDVSVDLTITLSLNGAEIIREENFGGSTYVFTNLSKGTYEVKVKQNGGCNSTKNERITIIEPDELNVQVGSINASLPDKATGSIEIEGIEGGSAPYLIELEGTENSNRTIFISVNAPDASGTTFNDLNFGIYDLTVLDANGCSQILNPEVGRDSTLFIPNVITPNGDDANETFYIRNLPDEGSTIVITSRWGREVFKSGNYTNDTAWGGEDTPEGIYFYKLEAAGKVYTGWVEVIKGVSP